MKTTKKTDYESPTLEIITLEIQGVLCGSAPDSGRSMSGGNQSMGIQDVSWP